jgi:cyclic-di-AMP phosphodiesterase PgpH
MTISGASKTRAAKVSSLVPPPNSWNQFVVWWRNGRRRHLQLGGLIVLTGLLLGLLIEGWNPPFAYQLGYSVPRDVTSRISFSCENPEDTKAATQRAKREVLHVYELDPASLVRLRETLPNQLRELLREETAGGDPRSVWELFFTPDELNNLSNAEFQSQCDLLRDSVSQSRHETSVQDDAQEATLEDSLKEAFHSFEEQGLMSRLAHGPDQGQCDEILVHPIGNSKSLTKVAVSDVLIGDGDAFRQELRRYLGEELGSRLFIWLYPRLEDTLIEDLEGTHQQQKIVIDAVKPVVRSYAQGQTLALIGAPLTEDEIRVLRAEHNAYNAERPLWRKLLRGGVITILLSGLFLIASMLLLRGAPRGASQIRSLAQLSILMIATVGLIRFSEILAPGAGRVELIGILLFAQIATIAYTRELAMILSIIATFVVALGTGHGIAEWTIVTGSAGAAILQLARIRSRRRLVLIGFRSAAATALLTLLIGVLDEQSINRVLLVRVMTNSMWTVIAGFLMTGLLPFLERPFGLLTDVSLLELTDISHPLLRELHNRAPATYAHSIAVGAIAERAAQSIGANDLLVRVGAYYHDIGKLTKPSYFYENQSEEKSRHDSLVPQMSALVIIGHVKDGADLARHYKLPPPIIDLIEQHHGTTLVQYFYSLAGQKRKDEEHEQNEVEESTYRYPGPKPQSREAAILMLSDASESACRAMKDATPQRIDSLVRNIAKQKLDDDQFDFSGLTLEEILTIEEQIIKTLIANHHGRIKYPELEIEAEESDETPEESLEITDSETINQATDETDENTEASADDKHKGDES